MKYNENNNISENQKDEKLDLAFKNLKSEKIQFSESFNEKTMSKILASRKNEKSETFMNTLVCFLQNKIFRYLVVPACACIILLLIFLPGKEIPHAGADNSVQLTHNTEKSIKSAVSEKMLSPMSLETKNGNILISQSSSNNWIKVKIPQQAINYGNELELKDKATALLKYKNGSKISLSNKANIKVLASSVYLKKGRAWFKINKTSKTFEIRTPCAVMEILGTVFMVSHDDKKGTVVYVKSGKVSVKNRLIEKTVTTGNYVCIKSENEFFELQKRGENNKTVKNNSRIPDPASTTSSTNTDIIEPEWDIDSSFGSKSLE